MPLHPQLVHFPIACATLAALLQLSAVIFRRPSLTLSAVLTLGIGAIMAGIGAIMAIAAAVTGTAQEEVVGQLPGIHDSLELHETLGNITTWVMGLGSLVIIYLHLKGKLPPWGFLVVLIALAILVQVTGHHGGKLVYQFGAGVDLTGKVRSISP